jgi:hypothetical protein
MTLGERGRHGDTVQGRRPLAGPRLRGHVRQQRPVRQVAARRGLELRRHRPAPRDGRQPRARGADGAAGVVIAATHAILSGPAIQRLKECTAREVIVTNTLPIDEAHDFDKLTTLSIAPLISRAIQEVFEDGSVTSLFDGHA